MRIGDELRDFSGCLRVLDHCTFTWHQRGGQMRVVAIDDRHCGVCVHLLERFGPWVGLVTSEDAADAGPLSRHDGIGLRHLKDQAALAVERRRHRRAAELYLALAHHEPNEPIWPLRAGESLRIAGQEVAAAEQFAVVAEAFAWTGAFHKALAACKVAMMLDPRHAGARALAAVLSEAPCEPPLRALSRGAVAS
jgi:hypothetical protein